MPGTWGQSLAQEDPIWCKATKPAHHNCWACTLEPGAATPGTQVPKACARQQERPPQWEPQAPQPESSSHSALEKAHVQPWRPSAAKNT